jgi:hypothetical protein
MFDKLEADINNEAFRRDPHRLEARFDWRAEQARDLDEMARKAGRRIMRLARLYAACRARHERFLTEAIVGRTMLYGEDKVARELASYWFNRGVDVYVRLGAAVDTLTREAFNG